MRWAARVAAGAIVGSVVACSNLAPPGRDGDAASVRGPGHNGTATSSAAEGASKPSTGPTTRAGVPTIARPHARWIAAQWGDLPGWKLDHVADMLPALLKSCERPAEPWRAACADLKRDPLLPALGDDAVRAWLEAHLRPWRVESLDGDATGLVTGYFEPLVDGSRTSRPGFRVPLHAPPADLVKNKPWYTRRDVQAPNSAAARSLRGHEVAWLRDPLDALVLHVQGSGRIGFIAANGQRELVRVSFAGHNEQPYQSVGRWLVDQGQLRLDQASWPAIRAWAKANPDRVDEMLAANPRYVFFREVPLPDPSIGPKGAQGVPLTPGRSIAVDPLSVPYGTPAWLDTTEPLAATPLRRLVVAQDTGTAITGAVRADYFWGWGSDAEASAGRMKQALRMWALWPR